MRILVCPRSHTWCCRMSSRVGEYRRRGRETWGQQGFIPRCVTALERVGDEALNTGNQDEASTAYSAALLLGPTTPNAVLTKWASTMLSRGSADEASRAAAKFKVPRFAVYRVICDGLLGGGDGRLTEALKCFQQMQNELPGDEGVRDERAEWELDFRGRCAEKLLVEKLREISRDSEKHNMADALSLNPTKSKRSKEVWSVFHVTSNGLGPR
ncbi:hypothetical protein HD554DRAFT_1519680 [Boletus coccyginus]|nr:hypothetical protein HD554DRAFT_1519680 [Boletus coccyginus]